MPAACRAGRWRLAERPLPSLGLASATWRWLSNTPRGGRARRAPGVPGWRSAPTTAPAGRPPPLAAGARGGALAPGDEAVLAHLLPGEAGLGPQRGGHAVVVRPQAEVVALLVPPGHR